MSAEPGSVVTEVAPDAGTETRAPFAGGLTLLGGPGVVCEGDSCALPGEGGVSAE